MLRMTFLTATIFTGLAGAALAGGGCDWSHGTTAGDYTPAPVADATGTVDSPVMLPTEPATETDEG